MKRILNIERKVLEDIHRYETGKELDLEDCEGKDLKDAIKAIENCIKEELTPIGNYHINDAIDGLYGEVQIGPYTYSSANTLKEVDPIAYNETVAELVSSDLEEGSSSRS